MRQYLLFIPLFFSAIGLLTAQSTFSSVLSSSERNGDALYSALIADLPSGEIIEEYQSSSMMLPASVVKLVTTASALKLLPEYPFITDFKISGEIDNGCLKGDLVIYGSGDPSLFSKYIPADSIRFKESLMAMLSSRGIRQIEGGVVVVADCFERQGFNPYWEEEDRGEWYGCGVYGFNLFDNWIKLYFQTKARGSKPILISQYPSNTHTVYQNELSVVAKGAYSHALGEELVNKRILKGALLPHLKRVRISIDLPNPPQFGASFITDLLRGKGIVVKEEGKAIFKPYENQTKLIGQYYGPSLETLIRTCNMYSLNHYAEALLKRMALEVNTIGSTQGGIAAEKALWKRKLSLLSNGARLVDGSGLSRSNRLSACDLYKVLFAMYKDSDHFQSFIQSLPEAGKEGSVRRFLINTPYKAFLKSGSMQGVLCYAGYITNAEKKYIVVLLSNNVQNRMKVRQAMQGAIEKVVLAPQIEK